MEFSNNFKVSIEFNSVVCNIVQRSFDDGTINQWIVPCISIQCSQNLLITIDWRFAIVWFTILVQVLFVRRSNFIQKRNTKAVPSTQTSTMDEQIKIQISGQLNTISYLSGRLALIWAWRMDANRLTYIRDRSVQRVQERKFRGIEILCDCMSNIDGWTKMGWFYWTACIFWTVMITSVSVIISQSAWVDSHLFALPVMPRGVSNKHNQCIRILDILVFLSFLSQLHLFVFRSLW